MIVPQRSLIVAGLLTLAVVLPARGQSTTAPATTSDVAVNVDPTNPGPAIPPDFAGLSVEMKTILPQPDGTYLFRPDNKPLVALFKTLGIHTFRAGGFSADNSRVAVPGPADLDSFFGFAEAAKLKILYTLRADTDASKDAVTAKYIMDHYKADVICFDIGNEGGMLAQDYNGYKDVLAAYAAALKTPDCSPDITFSGPNNVFGQGDQDWALQLAKDFNPAGPLRMISEHAYLGGNGRAVSDPEAARSEMLSSKWTEKYQSMFDVFGPAAAAAKVPFRIDETNSFYASGAKDVSDTHASALWALDYLHWWASHGAAGINFHTGDAGAPGNEAASCWYAAYWSSPDGYHAHPLGYAIKAFDAGSHGAILPVKLANFDNVNLTAYAVLGDDKNLYLTLINKENGEHPKDANITLYIDGYDAVESLALAAAQNDVASTDTETLGNARIGDDGSWAGTWTAIGGKTLTVAAGSATVVRLSPR
jgi:hypothetical protein